MYTRAFTEFFQDAKILELKYEVETWKKKVENSELPSGLGLADILRSKMPAEINSKLCKLQEKQEKQEKLSQLVTAVNLDDSGLKELIKECSSSHLEHETDLLSTQNPVLIAYKGKLMMQELMTKISSKITNDWIIASSAESEKQLDKRYNLNDDIPVDTTLENLKK